MGLPPQVLLVLALAGAVVYAAPTVKKGAIKVTHGIVHVVTLGHK